MPHIPAPPKEIDYVAVSKKEGLTETARALERLYKKTENTPYITGKSYWTADLTPTPRKPSLIQMIKRILWK